MTKDSFHLQTKDKTQQIHETKIDNNSNKKSLCYDLNNTNGICTYVIMDGIDIGWIWSDINLISRMIMNIINKKPISDSPSTTTNSVDNLEQLEKIQEQIQTLILSSLFLLVFVITCYVTLTKYDVDKKQYFGITNICYFIKDLVKYGSFSFKNKAKYNFLYITILFILALILFIIPDIIKKATKPKQPTNPSLNKFLGTDLPFGLILVLMFFIIIGLGWIILGNILFTSRSVLLISIIFVSSLLIGVIFKSYDHYKQIRQAQPDDQLTDTEISGILETIIKLVLFIVIITLVITLYLVIKNIKKIKDTSESVQGVSLTSSDKTLTDYFNTHIFNDLKDEQELLIKTITILKTDYDELIEHTDIASNDILKKEITQDFMKYLEKMLMAIKSKDEWFKKTCELYRLHSSNVNMSLKGKLPSFSQATTILKKLFDDDIKLLNEFRNNFGECSYVGNLAKDWVTAPVIFDLVRGGFLRIIEVFNIIVRNPIDILINSLKTIGHFMVHSFKKENKINELTDLNLLNYYYASLLKKGIDCTWDLAHKRTAIMYELFMQMDMPSTK